MVSFADATDHLAEQFNVRRHSSLPALPNDLEEHAERIYGPRNPPSNQPDPTEGETAVPNPQTLPEFLPIECPGIVATQGTPSHPPSTATDTTANQEIHPFQLYLAADAQRGLTGTTPKVSDLPCSEDDWVKTLQEVYEEDSNSSAVRTLARQYPRLWSLVTKFHKQWIKDLWVHPNKSSNGTMFKQKVIKAILRNRKFIPVQEVPATHRPTYDRVCKFSRDVFYYPKDEFFQFAKDAWMIDQGLEQRQLETSGSDIVRLFAVALLNINRDDLNSLNTSKVYTRRDADAALTLPEMIFHRWKQQYNDVCVCV